MNPNITMQKALSDYEIKKGLKERYAKMLVARAVRFYIENHLDGSVVAEDLYNYEDFDCDCDQDHADKGTHFKDCIALKEPYPNITNSEEHEIKFQKEL